MTVTQTFFFGVTNMATRNLILISGGPGIFDGKDPALHDTSWSNFIDCPLLLSKNALLVPSSDEQVWWFVFKKAYEDRWADDLKRPGGKNAVQNIKNKKMSSYVDLISSRAKEKSWSLSWLTNAANFWAKLDTFKDPISRVFYWGHARDDLWLGLTHLSNHEAASPPNEAIIQCSDIATHNKLKPKFQKGAPTRLHRFVGCNTTAFAKEWAKIFEVYAEGVTNKVDFSTIFDTKGEPSLSPGATRSVNAPSGGASAH